MPNTDLSEKVVSSVASIRIYNGRSVAWLSEKSGIADKTLRRRLSDPDQFTLAELNAIARALNCPIEAFFTEAVANLAEAS